MRRCFAALLLVLMVPIACGDDDDSFPGGGVGAACRDDFDCSSRCDEGFCTFPCNFDAQCPAGTACIDEHGGICAVMCGSDFDCNGLQCRSTNRRGAAGSLAVCRG